MLERALELDPDSFLAGYFRFCTLNVTGHFEEAVVRGQEVLMMSGRHAGTMATFIATYSDWGRRSEAEALYAELNARMLREYVPPSALGTASHSLGFQERAVAEIRQAIQIRDPFRHITFSKYFPYGARLHQDARCGDLLCASGF